MLQRGTPESKHLLLVSTVHYLYTEERGRGYYEARGQIANNLFLCFSLNIRYVSWCCTRLYTGVVARKEEFAKKTLTVQEVFVSHIKKRVTLVFDVQFWLCAKEVARAMAR